MFSQICSKLRKKLVLTGLLGVMFLALPGYGFAQSWADNMFEIKSHNFGSVPLKSDTQFEFVFTNKLKQDVQINSVNTSCHCTDVSYSKKVVKSGEQGAIIAKVNTSGQLKGKRGATLTVIFDKPTRAVVQLEVSVYIRPDVVLDPGSIDFGVVGEGKTLSKTVTLQYAGNPNWSLVKPIERANNNQFITATATEVKTPGRSDLITYKIVVTLNGKAVPGDVREILRFKTNEGTDAQGKKKTSIIELPVSAFVMDTLVVKPSPFQFGLIRPGETLTKYVVLQSAQPFHVRDARSNDPRFILYWSDQKSRVHIVAVTLTSKQTKDEKVSSTIQVQTDLQDQANFPITVRTHFVSSEESELQECYAPQWKTQIVNSLEYYNGIRSVIKDENERLDFDDPSKTVFNEIPVDEATVEKVTKPLIEDEDEEKTTEPETGSGQETENDMDGIEIIVLSRPNPPVMDGFAGLDETDNHEPIIAQKTEPSIAMKTGKVRFGVPNAAISKSDVVVESPLEEEKPVKTIDFGSTEPATEEPATDDLVKDIKLSSIFAENTFPTLTETASKPKSLKPTSKSIKGKPLPIIRPGQ